MPDYVVERLTQALNDRGKPVKGSRICILGMAYKKDVDDPRESPSFVLMDLLRMRGAVLSYNDPHVPRLPKMRHHDVPEMSSTPLTPDFLQSLDCVLVSTDHSAYDFDFISQHASLIIDTRNATRCVKDRQRIVKA
jgi:UDP-N-acetyl-D-glucosamine dehydrogenase